MTKPTITTRRARLARYSSTDGGTALHDATLLTFKGNPGTYMSTDNAVLNDWVDSGTTAALKTARDEYLREMGGGFVEPNTFTFSVITSVDSSLYYKIVFGFTDRHTINPKGAVEARKIWSCCPHTIRARVEKTFKTLRENIG